MLTCLDLHRLVALIRRPNRFRHKGRFGMDRRRSRLGGELADDCVKEVHGGGAGIGALRFQFVHQGQI